MTTIDVTGLDITLSHDDGDDYRGSDLWERTRPTRERRNSYKLLVPLENKRLIRQLEDCIDLHSTTSTDNKVCLTSKSTIIRFKGWLVGMTFHVANAAGIASYAECDLILETMLDESADIMGLITKSADPTA